MEKEMNKLPNIAVFELTYNCNHRCLFCSCPREYERKYQKDELSKDQWLDVIDTLAARGINHVSISGYDPLLRSDLEDILNYLSLKGMTINLIPNGKSMTDDLLHLISKLNCC